MTHRTARVRLFLSIAVLLLATALRFPSLATQSFWNDEGNTARLVERPISLIIEGAAGDIHPPGYYLLLHLWRAVAGETEFALRAYSALCGILLVAVAAALGRQATGAGGGAAGARSTVAAALLAAIHPLSVVYSGEARMYAQLGLVAALTLLAALRLVARATHCGPIIPPTRRRPYAGSIPGGGTGGVLSWNEQARAVLLLSLAIAAGLYTQYTYALALFALNVAFALWWLTQRPWRWRLVAWWVAAHALGGLLFLPWAPIAVGAAGWRPPDLAQGEAARALARTLLVGTTYPDAPLNLLLPVAAGLLLLAFVAGLRNPLAASRRRFATWAALSMAIVPAAIILVAGLYRPAYLKFLMMSVGPLSVALSASLASPSWDRHLPVCRQVPAWLRGVPPVALLLLTGLLPWQLRAIHNIRTDPAYIRDDYRGIAAQIRAEGRPGDAILLSAPNQWEVFTYYYGRQPEDMLPVYPAPYRPSQAEADAWVNDIVEKHSGGRLHVLYWGDTESDPQRHTERALATQAFKAGERWITTVRVAPYGTRPAATAAAEPRGVTFGDDIHLLTATMPHTDLRAGDILPLTLTWQAGVTPAERLKVFVHLIDDTGALVTQTDTEPVGGFAPTTTWQPGIPIDDRVGIALSADLAPGTYTLLTGLYTLSADRLPIKQNGAAIGDALPLHTLTVLPAD